jgi:predicted TIM-barrel fold metal-dependent hydrolase
MTVYRAISADSHVNEPAEMFRSRVPAHLKERAPRIIDLENGGEAWRIEDVPNPVPFGAAAVHHRATKRFDRAGYKARFGELKDGVQRGVRFTDILPGSFDPKERVKEQIEDKLDGEFFYNNPGVWGAIKSGRDKELIYHCFRAYNDWMAEFCAYDPTRMFPIGIIPTTGIDDAISELKRCLIDLNMKGVALESYPSGSLSDPSPEDDRFWALAEEIGKPISLHLSIRIPANAIATFTKGTFDLRKIIAGGSFQIVCQKLILAKVFDRFPKLRFVGAEVQSGWVPFYLERFDTTYRKLSSKLGVKLDLMPSEYFMRNIYTTFLIDQVGVNNRYTIGVDRMMWMCDFPHSVSNWPIDVELAHAQLKAGGVPADEWERLMWRTVADLYNVPYEQPAAGEGVRDQRRAA